MKILILKPSSLGDVIQALPVLRLLKRHHPAHEIYWWLSSDLVPLLQDDRDLAGIIPFDRRRWAAPWHWQELAASVKNTRARHFDLVIDLQGLLRSALFAWLVRGAVTIGLADPREGAPAFYDYAVPRPSPQTHAVDWYLRILTHLRVPIRGDYEWIPVRQASAARVADQLPGTPLIVLHPGARWANKRWPLAHFCALVKLIHEKRREVRFVILGGAPDAAAGQAIQAIAPAAVLDLTGRTTLPDMVEWIRLANGVVTNDTGPMHVAAALGKRICALFGPTDPNRTGPYGMKHGVLQSSLPCVPCMRPQCSHPIALECLWKIAPEMAAAAVEKMLFEGTV